MTYADERMAAETGRALLMLYRAGMQVRVAPDALRGKAQVRIAPGPGAKKRGGAVPGAVVGSGDSPLQALYQAVERLNAKAGAIVVELD